MAEYIDREEALISLLYGMVMTGYQSRAMDCVRFIPAADVAPVVHAHWIWKRLGEYSDGYNWRCSACRKESMVAINYCPNCGARMDEEN